MMLRRRFYLLALVLALVIPATVVYAYTPIETVILKDGATEVLTLDLVNTEVYQENNIDYTEYTYALTRIAGGPQQALSHWGLVLDPECLSDGVLVSPRDGNYETLTNLDVCDDQPYMCESSRYGVESGDNINFPGSSYRGGLKFEGPSNDLDVGETHIFRIKFANLLGDDPVRALATGGPWHTDGDEMITGPSCPGTTAVTLSSSNVSSPDAGALVPFVLIMGLALATISIVLWRREATTG